MLLFFIFYLFKTLFYSILFRSGFRTGELNFVNRSERPHGLSHHRKCTDCLLMPAPKQWKSLTQTAHSPLLP